MPCVRITTKTRHLNHENTSPVQRKHVTLNRRGEHSEFQSAGKLPPVPVPEEPAETQLPTRRRRRCRFPAQVTRLRRKGQTEFTWWFECHLQYKDGDTEDNCNLSREAWRLVPSPEDSDAVRACTVKRR